MEVTWDSKGEYRKNVEQLLKYGGDANRAAKKAQEIELSLKLDKDVKSQTTDHGENRIKNCVKYDLGNGYRLVTVQNGGIAIFIYIGDHDSTQRWLDKNKGLLFAVNNETKKITLTTSVSPRPCHIEHPATITLTDVPYLAQISGIQWDAIIRSRATRSVLLRFGKDGDEQELLEILVELDETQPREAELCHAVINHLRSGKSEAAQAAVDLYLGLAVETSDVAPLTGDIIRAEANQGRFVVINDLSDEELSRLHDPLRFREWMVFLHPGQRRVSDEDFAGPALLTGVSGSGKTCVLVHRARRLAKLFPNERILILTLNQSLSRLIEILKNDLCLGPEKSRIEVKAFHEYLSEVLSSLDCASFLRRMADFTGMKAEVESFLQKTPPADHAGVFKPISEQAQMAAFEEFLAEKDNRARAELSRLEIYVYSQDQTLDLRRYLFEELELVRSAFSCDTEYKEYIATDPKNPQRFTYQRAGRSIQFAEKRREAVLNILREWEKFQLRRGFLDIMGLAQAAVFAVEDNNRRIPDSFRYRAVLVDEFQDLSTLELNLLQQIPTVTENGLFLTGDFAQKIHAKDLSLPKAGLGRDVRTDRIIRRNYRNSRQVLLAAQSLLEAYPPQLAGGEEDVAVLNPEYANQESAVPIATQANDPIRAAWQYAEEWLSGGHVPFSVCIATANTKVISPEAILKRKPAAVDADLLTGDYLLKVGRVVVADISAVKGFEFSLILICGLDEGCFPATGVPAAEHWREAMRLYVAITRGRDEVRFIYQNTPSPFLTAMDNKIQFQTWDGAGLPKPSAEPVKNYQAPPTAEPQTPIPTTIEPALKEIIPLPTLEASPQPQPTEAPSVNLQESDSNAAAASEEADAFEPEFMSAIPTTITPTPNRDRIVDFLDKFSPVLLNGILVVQIPSDASERELVRCLGKNQIEVALVCQRNGHFAAPDKPLPHYIIRAVCDYFCVAPNIINYR